MARTDSKKQSSSEPLTKSSGDTANRGFVLIVGLVLVLGLAAVAFAATRGVDGDSSNSATETGDGESSSADGEAATADAGTDADAAPVDEVGVIELVGDVLPPMPDGVTITDSTTDPAAGTVAPTLVGAGFDGEEVTIEPDGSAKAIYFLAHWCPHCQAEVPLVQELIDAGAQPDGLEIYAVSTAVDEGRGNYPPSAWFDNEGLAATLVRDDEATAGMSGFGGRTFPYVVYLDADHKVVARSAGSLDKETIEQLWLAAAG